MKMPLFRSAFAATIAAFAALVFAAAPAWAGSQPQGALDECYGKTLAVHVKGWTYDPDVSSQSTGVQVYLYADSGCTRQYGDVRILAADRPRSDVNRVKGVEGDHGFDADIPVPAGTYWVKVFAVDATGDGNLQARPATATCRSARREVSSWRSAARSSFGRAARTGPPPTSVRTSRRTTATTSGGATRWGIQTMGADGFRSRTGQR